MGLNLFGNKKKLPAVADICISCKQPLIPGALFCETCGPPSLPVENVERGMTKGQTAASIAVMLFFFSTLVILKLGMSFEDVYSSLFPPTIQEQALPQDPDFKVIHYVNVKRANVRDKPSSEAKVLTVLGKGVQVKVLEPGEDWTKIDLNGKSAWISAGLLTTSVE